MTPTSNPAVVKVIDMTPRQIKPPSPAVVERQDPEHTEADFKADLGKATRQQSPS